MRPRHRILFSVLLSTAIARPAQGGQDKCLECHRTNEDARAAAFLRDVHRVKGITCAGCHGGDATSDDIERAMSAAAGFIGVPKGDAISTMCARCHADSAKMRSYGSSLPASQWEDLRSSVHARSALSGKEQIVQCTTCHASHGIVPVRNPASPVSPLNVVKTCASCHANIAYMRSYNPSLPVDQLEKYRLSVHGIRNAKGDRKAAECVSCHGSHGILNAKNGKSKVYVENLPSTCSHCHSDAAYMKEYGIPTNQFQEYAQSVHGVALLQKHDRGAPACNGCHGNHGAVPPGVESISKVCGMCHVQNADLFASSPHKRAFEMSHDPECETCHGNHGIKSATSELLGVEAGSVCAKCHSASQNPKGFAAARIMQGLIDTLQTKEAHAKSLVDQAEQKGMEIGEAKFRLRDVRQSWLQARTAVHAFDLARMQEVTGAGVKTAETISDEAREAIDEYFFRRVGLGISTIIITFVAGSLYFFVRRIERRQRGR